MQKFKNILIEIKEIERPLNPLILNLVEILKAEKIFFCFLEPINTEREDNSSHMSSDLDQKKEHLQLSCNKYLPQHLEYELIWINKDHPIKSLLQTLIIKDIDLLIFEYGKSSSQKEEIIKIAKISYCSILLIPENNFLKPIKRILVPVDFSNYSRHAMELALEIVNTGKILIVLNHVYYVPADYHATGKSYEESANLEKLAAKKECQKFLKDYNLYNEDISYSYILDDDRDPTDKIYKDAVDNETDLIIIGAKGKTQSPEILTGSIAFSLLLYNQQIPMMIIKNKKENYDLAEDIIRNI